MPSSLRHFLHWLVYGGLALLAGGLMLLGKADAVLVERLRLQVNDVLVPVLDVISQPAEGMAVAVDQGVGLITLLRDKSRLQQERDELLRWQAIAQRLQVENSELRRLLNFQPDPPVQSLSARVVADTTGAFTKSFLLNAGSLAGVSKDQIALTGEGLVGRIVAVSARASRVLLITDMNSRVPVFVGASRARAVLAGNNSDQPRLIHISPDANIAVGDRVVTAGIAGAFPPGLPVGLVHSVDEGHILIEPFVDASRVEYVRLADFGLQALVDSPTPEDHRDARANSRPPEHSAVRADAR